MRLVIRYLCLIFLILVPLSSSKGQQVPNNPISYRIYLPFILNPAIAGSKDFSSLDFEAGWQGKSTSQILSFNSRLLKHGATYFTSNENNEPGNIGTGVFLFNEENSSLRNSGASLALAYHIPVDKKSLSFISVGASAKIIYNTMKSVISADPLQNKVSKSTLYSDFDLGIYYYNPFFYAGVSSTNLPGNPLGNDSLSLVTLPVSRQFFFITGFKFVISKPLSIVLEPSVMLNAQKTRTAVIKDIMKPGLKLYMQDFCIGTFINNYKNISFFFQYRFPKIYVGSFFEIPQNTPYFQKEINFEFAIGMDLSRTRNNPAKSYHW